jgi:Protein of unknown function (DUF2442)
MAKRRTSLSEILAQIPAARARSAREWRAGRRATSVRYDRPTGRVVMELSNGYLVGFPISAIPELSHATSTQLAEVELFPAGDVLHWEALDADLSVPGLLLSSVGRKEKLSEFARIAGKAKSPAKAAASRANGAKGGRPRKTTR